MSKIQILECAMISTKCLDSIFLISSLLSKIIRKCWGNIIIGGGLLPRVLIDNDDYFQKLIIQSCVLMRKEILIYLFQVKIPLL